MHDQVLTLLDDCVTKLMVLRADLAAARCVRLGERRGIALQAIDIADEFAVSASLAIGETLAAMDPVEPVVLSEVAC